MQIQDAIGQPIQIGDYVVYGSGRSQVNFGKVLNVSQTTQVYSSNYRRTFYLIKVRAATGFYSGNPRLAKRDSTLNYPDRMVVMPVVPPHINQLYIDAGL